MTVSHSLRGAIFVILQWGFGFRSCFNQQNKFLNHITMRKINKIIVHCTATPAGRNVEVSEIDRWHRQRGFNGIGYHYVVMLDGGVKMGRPVEIIGAHCKGQNAESVGVVYVGGMSADNTRPMDTRTREQKGALRTLIKKLLHDYPGSTVHSHYEFAAKACPCFDAAKEYADL